LGELGQLCRFAHLVGLFWLSSLWKCRNQYIDSMHRTRGTFAVGMAARKKRRDCAALGFVTLFDITGMGIYRIMRSRMADNGSSELTIGPRGRGNRGPRVGSGATLSDVTPAVQEGKPGDSGIPEKSGVPGSLRRPGFSTSSIDILAVEDVAYLRENCREYYDNLINSDRITTEAKAREMGEAADLARTGRPWALAALMVVSALCAYIASLGGIGEYIAGILAAINLAAMLGVFMGIKSKS
jgi:hypothetical protein